MKTLSNFFIVSALTCISATVAYSQDCNSYLRQAAELVSQKKYCDAKVYYQKYKDCDADADVSTEIAMCDRYCKIQVMDGGEDETVVTTEMGKPTPERTSSDNRTDRDKPAQTRTSSSSSTVKPVKSTQGFNGFNNITFGARAGMNFTKFGGSDANVFLDEMDDEFGMKMKNPFKPGIQLGVVVNIPIKNEIMFQSGIIFTQQGAKWKGSISESEMGITIKGEIVAKMNLNYLQIPLNILYRHDLNNDFLLLLQAGPYLGYGINGKIKGKTTVSVSGLSKEEMELLKLLGVKLGSESEEEELKFGEEDGLKRLDLGVGLGAGLLFKEKIHVGLGYNIGLAKIVSDVDMKNNGIALTLTYMFGK